jgi:hypothetical protein
MDAVILVAVRTGQRTPTSGGQVPVAPDDAIGWTGSGRAEPVEQAPSMTTNALDD